MRDVAAHTVAYLDQGRFELLGAYARARFDVDRLNARALDDDARRTPAGLAHRMRQGIEPWGAGALYGGRVALIECLVHQLDVRRPLRLPRRVPDEALSAALDYALKSPVIKTPRGLRFVATDLDWAGGRGRELAGPAEELLLAMTGRR